MKLKHKQRGFLLNPIRFSSGGGSDPSYSSVSLLLHGDGTNGSTTVTDNSPTPKTVTAFGNANISTAQSKFGGSSMYFDGAGDYLDGPVSTDFNFGTGDFTIECSVYLAGWGSAGIFSLYYTSLLGCREQNTTGGWTLWLDGTSTSKTAVNFSTTSGGAQASYSFSLNTWYSITVTRQSGVIYFFVNGTLITSAAFATDTGTAKKLSIGYHQDTVRGNTFYLNGYLDEVRVTKGVARYTATFTPPTAAFPNS